MQFFSLQGDSYKFKKTVLHISAEVSFINKNSTSVIEYPLVHDSVKKWWMCVVSIKIYSMILPSSYIYSAINMIQVLNTYESKKSVNWIKW